MSQNMLKLSLAPLWSKKTVCSTKHSMQYTVANTICDMLNGSALQISGSSINIFSMSWSSHKQDVPSLQWKYANVCCKALCISSLPPLHVLMCSSGCIYKTPGINYKWVANYRFITVEWDYCHKSLKMQLLTLSLTNIPLSLITL